MPPPFIFIAKMRRVLANAFGEVWAMALGSVVGRISPVRKLCSNVPRLMAPDCHADTSAGISVAPVSDASKSEFSS